MSQRVSFNGAFSNILQHWKLVLPLVLIVLAMFITYDVRDDPIELEGIKDRIEQTVLSQVQSAFSTQVESQYPLASPALKEQKVAQLMAPVIKTGTVEMNGQTFVIKDIVEQQFTGYKAVFQTDEGQTYMGSIDPFFYYMFANNLNAHGSMGDTLAVVDGKEQWVITRRNAPTQDVPVGKPEMHVWLMSKLYELYGISSTSSISERFNAIFLLPVYVAMLAIIPAFFLVRRFSNDWFAFLGAVLMTSVGIYVSRTVAGSVDNDAYSVLFPVAIVCLVVYALSSKKYWQSAVFGVCAGLLQGWYATAWDSSTFIFVFCVASVFAYLGHIALSSVVSHLKTHKHAWVKELSASMRSFWTDAKLPLVALACFAFTSFVAQLALKGTNIFTMTRVLVFGGQASFVTFDSANIWPNVYSSVAELNPANFGNIVDSLGGSILFTLAFIGLVLLVLSQVALSKHKSWFIVGSVALTSIWVGGFVQKTNPWFASLLANHELLFVVLLFVPVGLALAFAAYRSHTTPHLFLAIILSVWMAGTMYMSFNGVRFIMLLGPAFSFATVIGLFYLFSFVVEKITKLFTQPSKYVVLGVQAVGLVLFAWLAIFPQVSTAYGIGESPSILFDDAWYEAFTYVKANAQEDAILTSWWDYGHFFNAIAERGSTFDGANQASPASYWVGHLLMENNMSKAVDMLRMVVCGNNRAFDALYDGSTYAQNVRAIDALLATFGTEDKRSVLLSFGYSDEQVDAALPYLACETPPQSLVVASEDMVGKAGVWAHWGSWDFAKKYVLDRRDSESVSVIASQINRSPETVTRWISELQRLSIQARSMNIKETDLINQWLAPYPSYVPIQGAMWHPCTRTNESISCQNSVVITRNYSVSTQLRDIAIGRMFIAQNGTLSEIVLSDSPYDLVLRQEGDSYSALIAAYPLGGSLFTRLFYLDGAGADEFTPMTYERSYTQGDIFVYETLFD